MLNEDYKGDGRGIDTLLPLSQLHYVLYHLWLYWEKSVSEGVRKADDVYQGFKWSLSPYHSFDKKHWHIWKKGVKGTVGRIPCLSSSAM